MSNDPWIDSPCRPGVDPASLALDQFDLSNPDLFQKEAWGPFFRRLRDESPVNYTAQGVFGPFWSVTRYADIRYVDMHHQLFSSEPTILLGNPPKDFLLSPGFIAMDAPRHGIWRGATLPVMAPANLARLEPMIRARACDILDALPVGEDFDWVDRVSIELTTSMLAVLFDVPFEDRRKLAWWSDVATSSPRQTGSVELSQEEWRRTMLECLEYFTVLWNERVNCAPGDRLDLVSMLAHNPHTRSMSPFDYLGNLLLLIVGGNDTTRHSISGGVLALERHPAERIKLEANRSLIPGLVAETIRWQTPLAYMRRTARQDLELGGKHIRAGDKVLMWYISGNRDERAVANPDAFIIDRERPQRHLAFGSGVHRCMGSRLAEMQLSIVWEEILRRFRRVEVTGEPVGVRSSFVHGYERMLVRLHPR